MTGGARSDLCALHVITDTNRRGAQVFAVDLTTELACQGRAGALIALRPGDRGAQLDVPVVGTGPRSWRTLRDLRRSMRSRPVVVAHGSNTLFACVVAGAGLGVPIVYRNISDPAYWLSSTSRRIRVRALLTRVSRVVALWPGGATYLRETLGVPDGKIEVVPNAVRSALFRPPTATERAHARRSLGCRRGSPSCST